MGPGSARARHRFGDQGSDGAVISSRRARGQPARGARSQGGNEYLATWPLGPAGMNPRRDEITTSTQRGQARTRFTDASRTRTASRNIAARQRPDCS
jgi:hypothetical protein